MLVLQQSDFDTANYFLFAVYVYSVVSMFLPRLAYVTGLPFDPLTVASLSPILNDIVLASLIIIPAAFLTIGCINKEPRTSSFLIASAYLVLYGSWLLLPDGSRILDDGSLLFLKNPIYFAGALAIPTVYFALAIVQRHLRVVF